MNEQPGESDQAPERHAGRIDLAHQADFAIGPIEARPSLRSISGPHGQAKLEPKVMQVLVALSGPVGTVLSRDDLIDRCWNGRVVGDTSINRVISLLRSALREVAGEAVVVENVPTVGYRILLQDRPEVVLTGRADSEEEAEAGFWLQAMDKLSRRGFAIGTLALIGLGLALALFWLRPFGGDRVSEIRVAMLPLAVAEGVDPIYAAGLESELRAELARVGAMEVTASETAKLLLEEGLSPIEIGRRLGVDHIFEGNFGVTAEQAALDLEVIDVESGKRILSEQLRSAPGEAQHLPFRTARSISLALGRPTDASMVSRSVSADDFRLLMLAKGMLLDRGEAQLHGAREILEGITRRNPDYSSGWGALAKAYFLRPVSSAEEFEENHRRALEMAKRALDLRPDAVEGLKITGLLADEAETGLGNLRRAVALDPGDSEAIFWLSIAEKRFLLEGGNPLASARQMVQVDPLWPASWNASTLAAEAGDLELAREFERNILAAAVTPSQKLLARARMARLDGDLSTFLRFVDRAERTATDAERRWGLWGQDRMVRLMLGLPLPEGRLVPRDGTAPLALMRKVDNGELPPRSELAVNGLTGASMWDASQYAFAAAPLYLQFDRHEELLSDYDARFASPAEFAQFAKDTLEPEATLAALGPAIVMAMRRAGRTREAATHLEALEAVHERLENAAPRWLDTVMLELDIAALRGDSARAAELVAQLPEFGWPYAIVRTDPTVLGLLRDDPLYDEIRKSPQVRGVLDPIIYRLTAEREEALDT